MNNKVALRPSLELVKLPYPKPTPQYDFIPSGDLQKGTTFYHVLHLYILF